MNKSKVLNNKQIVKAISILCFFIALVSLIIFVLTYKFTEQFPYGTRSESLLISFFTFILGLEFLFAKRKKEILLFTAFVVIVLSFILRLNGAFSLIITPVISWTSITLVIILGVSCTIQIIKSIGSKNK